MRLALLVVGGGVAAVWLAALADHATPWLAWGLALSALAAAWVACLPPRWRRLVDAAPFALAVALAALGAVGAARNAAPALVGATFAWAAAAVAAATIARAAWLRRPPDPEPTHFDFSSLAVMSRQGDGARLQELDERRGE
jgi:hypothetical protein